MGLFKKERKREKDEDTPMFFIQEEEQREPL